MSNQVCAAVRIKKWIQLSNLLQFHINWILWKSSESKAWKPQSSSLIQSHWKEMIHVWKMRRFSCREKCTQCLTTSSEKSRNTEICFYTSADDCQCHSPTILKPLHYSHSHICHKYLQILFKKCFSRNVKESVYFSILSYKKTELVWIMSWWVFLSMLEWWASRCCWWILSFVFSLFLPASK